MALHSTQELIDNRKWISQNEECNEQTLDMLREYPTKPCVLICVNTKTKIITECHNIQTLLHSNNPNDTITAMDISNDST